MFPGSTCRRPMRPLIGTVIRVGEVEPCVVNRRLILLDGSFILGHGRYLCVQLLLRDGFLCKQCAVACEIDPGVCEQRLIPDHLTFRLIELNLEWTGVDLCQQLTLRDE